MHKPSVKDELSALRQKNSEMEAKLEEFRLNNLVLAMKLSSMKDVAESQASGQVWVQKESRSLPGKVYWLNNSTGERSWKNPIFRSPSPKSPREHSGGAPGSSDAWVVQESRRQPGKFYYLNTRTGQRSWNSPSPGASHVFPVASPNSNKDFADLESSPSVATSASRQEGNFIGSASNRLKEGVKAVMLLRRVKSSNAAETSPSSVAQVPSTTQHGPTGSNTGLDSWIHVQSRSKPGRDYFLNSRTGERSWDDPSLNLKSSKVSADESGTGDGQDASALAPSVLVDRNMPVLEGVSIGEGNKDVGSSGQSSPTEKEGALFGDRSKDAPGKRGVFGKFSLGATVKSIIFAHRAKKNNVRAHPIPNSGNLGEVVARVGHHAGSDIGDLDSDY